MVPKLITKRLEEKKQAMHPDTLAKTESKHGKILLIREHKCRLHGCSLFYFNSSIAV